MKFQDLLKTFLDQELKKSKFVLLTPIVLPENHGFVFVTKGGQIFQGTHTQIKQQLLEAISLDVYLRYQKRRIATAITDLPCSYPTQITVKRHLLLSTNIDDRLDDAVTYWTSCSELTEPTGPDTYTPCKFSHFHI
jgi:hypothetical protein